MPAAGRLGNDNAEKSDRGAARQIVKGKHTGRDGHCDQIFDKRGEEPRPQTDQQLQHRQTDKHTSKNNMHHALGSV
jgi:hypothetical protein